MPKSTKKPTPAIAAHPGMVLGDLLKARKIKQKSLAEQIGIAPTQLNEIVKGKRAINTSVALLLEAAFGIDAHAWTHLQTNYEIVQLEKDQALQEQLRKVRTYRAER